MQCEPCIVAGKALVKSSHPIYQTLPSLSITEAIAKEICGMVLNSIKGKYLIISLMFFTVAGASVTLMY